MNREIAGAIFALLICAVMFLGNRIIGDLYGAIFLKPDARHPYIKLKSGRYLLPDLGAGTLLVVSGTLFILGVLKLG